MQAAETLDPVCGMTVSAQSPHRLVHAEETHSFCSASCLAKFRAEPQRYLASTPQQEGPHRAKPHAPASTEPLVSAKVDSATQWTCPMHPEIVRNESGACPICGMALEPMEILEDTRSPELDGMTRRFWVSLGLTLPVFGLTMAEMLPGMHDGARFSPRSLAWIQLALATPVVLFGGWPFFTRGWSSLRMRHLNMSPLRKASAPLSTPSRKT